MLVSSVSTSTLRAGINKNNMFLLIGSDTCAVPQWSHAQCLRGHMCSVQTESHTDILVYGRTVELSIQPCINNKLLRTLKILE